MLINSLSVHGKGFSNHGVENIKQLWISLIAQGENYDNFCMPLRAEGTYRKTQTSLRGNKTNLQLIY